MQSLNSASMINSGTVTVSGISLIPSNAALNTVGQIAVSGPNQHHLAQSGNIQLIIATKSLPQAVPVTAQVGTSQLQLKQDVISIPVSATQMVSAAQMVSANHLQAVKQVGEMNQMIALPVMSQVNTGTTTCMLVSPSAISTIGSNQFMSSTSQPATIAAANTNVITTHNNNTITVTGQTPGLDLLACLECGKHFVSVAKLKSHEKTHSKSRPFKCIDCNKSFTVRYSLICHTRTHTRERPYQCSQCGSRFTQASSLKTHQIYKHTKNFPYACKQCDRGFISPGQRHEHVVRTHLKMSGTVSSRSKSKSKSKAASQQSNVSTVSELDPNTITISNATSISNGNQICLNTGESNTLTLVNATILQPTDVSTQVQQGQIDTDQLPPGSTITLAIQAIAAPDSDDSLGPSMSSAACQTSLSLPPLL